MRGSAANGEGWSNAEGDGYETHMDYYTNINYYTQLHTCNTHQLIVLYQHLLAGCVFATLKWSYLGLQVILTEQLWGKYCSACNQEIRTLNRGHCIGRIVAYERYGDRSGGTIYTHRIYPLMGS